MLNVLIDTINVLIDAIRDWVNESFVKKGNGEDTKAIIGRYNVLDYGIKNDGVTDNTATLQNLINSIPEGSVVFFPKGVYVITDEISIPRSMTFEGVPIFGNQISHGSLYFAKSQITLVGTKENISMFNVTASWAEFNVYNLAFIGNSYHTSFVNKNTAWVSAPTHIIVEKERNSEDSDLMYIRDGINGITHLNGGGIAMRNCMFAGFSGYGTTIGTSQDIHDCVFYECKIGIKELEYDSKIRRCWFSRGETAIFCSWERERAKYNTEPVGDKDANGNSKGIRYYITLQVTDCWCDMMRGHFIHVESKTPNEAYHTVKLLVNDNWVDMLDSSAIYVDGAITQSSITGSFSRIGMMWANTNGDARTTANALECDIVNAYAIHNSDIHVTTEMWNYANGQKRRIGHDQLHSTFRNLICPTRVVSARNDNLITETDIVAYDAPLENITGNTYGMRNVRISCGKTDITRQRTLDLSQLYVLSPSNSLPDASKDWLGMTVLLTANSSRYVKGAHYRCVASTSGGTTTYSWEPVGNAIRTYSTMPTDAELLEMLDGTKFYAQGYYDILDGNGGYYKVTTTSTDNSRMITNGTKTVYLLPLNDEGHVDNIINPCRYGVRECTGSLVNKTAENTYATLNSNIIDSIVLPGWSVGGTWKFPKGRFYFERTIDLTARSRNIVGAETPRINDNVFTDAHIRCGTMLIFPFLNNGDSAIISGMGNVENIAILGDSANYDFSIDRTKTITAPNDVVTEVIKQVTEDGETVDYKCIGLNKTNNGTIKNVAIANFYTGYTSDLTNIYVNHLNTLKCHIGVSVKNDIKCVGLYSWNVHTALQIRGSLVSVVQLRVDSCVNVVHISAKSSKVTLVDVDGDWCTEELIKIGNGESYVDVFESTFLAVHGRCNTLKSYAKTGGVKPSASTLNESNSEGYGLIRIVQKGKFHDNYVQCAGLGGNTFDNSESYILPKILLTFENETVQKNNTFVVNDEEMEDSIAYVKSLIQLGWVTSCKLETALNTYYVTRNKIINSTPKETTVLPTASANDVGKSYLYTGTTTAEYQKGGTYECRQTSSDTYEWKLTNLPLATVKDIVANSTDFANFQSNIALL